ncbi:MAG: type I pullulanase [Bacteroidota bacterium]
MMPKFIKILLFCCCALPFAANAQKPAALPVYSASNLGLSWHNSIPVLRVWAPYADSVLVQLFNTDLENPVKVLAMKKGIAGSWAITLNQAVENSYYKFVIKNKIGSVSKWSKPVSDPYAIAVSPNGTHAAIVNLNSEKPAGWDQDSVMPPLRSSAIVIYELQVRDASAHNSSGVLNKRKYLGLTEKGRVNSFGQSTGLDHLIELGVTHVHLLPVFDFNSSNEIDSVPPYNWGYDPLHYNTPEGSFASENKNPGTRIREFRKLVQSLHQSGMRVVMDVVYNHTALTETSSFEQIVPGYYYRKKNNGEFSNASACGNETASEQPMFRQFMLQSLLHWVREYHIDGFRFDLMGIHDIATMNYLADSLRKVNPGILLYGEGWTAGTSPLPDSARALKKNVANLAGIAVFGDEFRDGLKGSVFNVAEKGWLGGDVTQLHSILYGLVGGINHPAIDYQQVNYSKQPIAITPAQLIAYADCHDNHTLWDRLSLTHASLSEKTRIDMHKQALTAVLLSQSPSFIQAGTEFLRSKNGVENSFESPDSINAINWDLKYYHQDVFAYVKRLIALKKSHPAFQLTNWKDRVKFYIDNKMGLLGYYIDARFTSDSYQQWQIWFNPTAHEIELSPSQLSNEKGWKTLLANYQFFDGLKPIGEGEIVKLPPHQSLILVKEK